MRLVACIYAEEWVINKLPEEYYQQSVTKFEKWPIEEEGKTIVTVEQTKSNIAIDYVITIGGDGTLLTLLRSLQDYERMNMLPPIITFAQGSLNYLGNFDIKEYQKVLDATVVKSASFDKICLDQRMRLAITLKKALANMDPTMLAIEKPQNMNDDLPSEIAPIQYQSLNEVTIMRNNEAMAQIEIYINNVLLTVVQGDGVLIATPTGSTAYNLSCGGSIVHYSAQVICVTPIAPHSLSFRPIILPANVDIKIRIPSTARTSSKVTIDGHTKLDLHPEDYLIIKKSPLNVPFVRWSHENQDQLWSTRLYKQLKWNKHIVQKPLKKLVEINPKL